uniref:Uncharacterized protein n=1 Tax=Vitis vinifera TaxID=29760 RepID=F6GZ37_VITVI
MENKSTPIEP